MKLKLIFSLFCKFMQNFEKFLKILQNERYDNFAKVILQNCRETNCIVGIDPGYSRLQKIIMYNEWAYY
jgi:hypothetical protein